jgi:hypothetical protein
VLAFSAKFIRLMALWSAAGLGVPASLFAASPPKQLAHFTSMPKPAVLHDGTWAAYFIDHEGPGLPPTPAQQHLYVRYSKDRGDSWSEPETLLDLPADAGGFGYNVILVDNDGEVHLFMLCDAGTGVVRPRPADSGQSPVEPLARQRLDIWHVKSSEQGKRWPAPQRIWEGRAGDLQSVIQTRSGRIVLPICYYVDRSWSDRGEGLASYTFTGQFDTTALYSDDAGKTWQRSTSVLRTATPDLASYGAVEPIVLQLNDGRVWMLLRTQLGRFYEAFSDDGSTWSDASPTEIKSSDSPAGLARLPDGRILLLWNNCQRHPYAQGSRQVLHAAVSADEGKTWSGYREIVLDPHRDDPPPPSGDHGVSYPFLAVSPDGSVVFSLWVQTGEGRSLWRLDPSWLTEGAARTDFSHGLEQWSTFGTRGVSTSPHPTRPDAKVLMLEKSDPHWPSAAIWNFPAGSQGQLKTRVLIEKGAPNLSIELTDHFSPPFDEQSRLYSLFDFQLADESTAGGAAQAPGDRWVNVELRWNCQQRQCELTLDGVPYGSVSQRHDSRGPSYLRLSLGDNDPASARVLVDEISAETTMQD